MFVNKKQGITLIYLIVTIIVMIILATTVVSQMIVPSDTTEMSTFAENLSQVQDAVRASYLLDKEIPTKDGTSPLTKEQLLDMVTDTSKKEELEIEIANNKELDSSNYYIIDLDKLDVTKEEFGYGKKGEDDIYVVSSSSLRVYYLYGVEYEGENYFSLNSKLANILNVPDTSKDSSVTSVESYEGIQIQSSNALYTNNMQVKIDVNLKTGESLKIGFNGVSDKTFNISTGNSVIEFSSLEDLNNIGILSQNFSASEISALNNLSKDNAKLVIKKYDGDNFIGKYDILVSNFDNASPTLSLDSKTLLEDNATILNMTATDVKGVVLSGIDQIRYEYSKYKDGTINNDISDEYMEKRAKSISFTEDGKFSIKVPQDVSEVVVAAIDKAGNIYTMTVTM